MQLTMKSVNQNKSQWDDIFKCDKCAQTFKGEDVIVKEDIDNFDCVTPMMMSRVAIKHEDKIYNLHCPLCKSVHLFGFDKAK